MTVPPKPPPPPPIRFFVSAQELYGLLGICQTPQIESKWTFNRKNVFIVYLFVQMFLSAMAFCLFDAKTIFDYCINVYVSITVFGCIFTYSPQIIGKANIFTFIHKIDELIENRKLNSPFLFVYFFSIVLI